MSKIGEYVHYHLMNYQKFGTTREEIQSTSGISQANEAFSTQKKAIKHFLKEKDLNLKEMENRLTEMHGFLTSTDVPTKDNVEKSKILQEFFSQFQADLEGRVSGASINYNTLSVYANSGFSKAQYDVIIQQHREGLKKFKNNPIARGVGTYKTIRQDTILKRIRELTHIKKTLINELKRPAQAEELISLIEQIQNIYNTGIVQEFAKHGGTLPRNFKGLGGSKNGLITLINKAFSEVRMKQIPSESGKLAEMAANIFVNMATLQAGASLADILSNFEGDITYNKVYKTSSFGEGLNFAGENFGDTATIKLPGTQIQVDIVTDIGHKGQQGKIDFRFSDIDKGLNNVGVSHKAYFLNNQPNIHIHSGSNLLFMMQDYPDFSNHYLNVMASHKDDGSVGNLSTARGLAKEALKLTILAYSLSGGFMTDQGPMDKAEVLTVFNKSTQSYHAFSIYNILNRASENIEKYLDLEDDLKELNNEGNNAVSRINGLLTQLRTASIKASIKKEALGFK